MPQSSGYPKYVAPDPSHIIVATRPVTRTDGFALVDLTAPPMPRNTVQDFAAFHSDRAGNVTVLVRNAAEETKALAVKS